MTPQQCTLNRVLDAVDQHLDELKKWNHGGLTKHLQDLDQILGNRPDHQQTWEWLDSLASRDTALMQFLLSPVTTHVSEVASAVETILRNPPSAVEKGPSAQRVAETHALPGQVCNSAVLLLRTRIRTLTELPEALESHDPESDAQQTPQKSENSAASVQ